jgi:AraC-like DNA-binding protein
MEMSRAIAVFHGCFGRATIYQLNRPFNVHAHREGHLIFHLGGSDGGITVGDTFCPLTTSSFVAVCPWEPHNFVPSDLHQGSLFFVLYVNPEWFTPGAIGDAARLRFGRPLTYRTSTIDRQIRRTAAMVYSAHGLSELDRELRGLIDACYAETWRRPNETPERRVLEGVTDFRVRKSIRLIQEGLGADIQLDDVARESGLSRPHFYKLFRSQTGVTPNLYLNTLLMERAIDVLVKTENAVADIGFNLGFSSQSAFTRFFASNVGMAPTDYRSAAQVL